jgi:serine/threonine protein kinase
MCILIHRDIALRNCLVTHDSTVKLSSIALCKDKHANEYFKHNSKMIALRHLAPEVLKSSSFSTASDMFACGVTIWEVMNFGALPFETIGNEEFLQMLQNDTVDYGKLLEQDKMPSDLKKTLVRVKQKKE